MLTRVWGGPLVVFARARGLARATGLLAATAVLATLVPVEPVDVRFRAATIGLGPLLAGLPGVWLPVLLAPPGGALEPRRAMVVRLARAGWLSLLLVAGWACGVLALSGASGAAGISARNLAIVGGLSLLAGQVLPPFVTWLPACVALGITVVYGTVSMSGRPQHWALLLAPLDRTSALGLAAALFVPGAALYVVRDGAA